jgi:SAM-dependent methyltransferase
MSSVTTPATAGVTDEYVVVDASVVDPVVVSFDDQYVWSFAPRRDGSRSRQGWRVPWPQVLKELLDGTTSVRLSDSVGGLVHFEGQVSFNGNQAPLALRDAHGNALAVDKAGHLTRVFSETGGDVRRDIAEGTARAIADLRDRVGIDAHVSYGCLLGAVRDGHMIGHDSDADLAYLSRWTHPADIVRESFRMERELRTLGWKVIRMSGADLKLLLPVSDGRVVHVDIFGAFHVGDTFYQLGGRSGVLDRAALTPATTVVLEGVELAAPADPEAVLEFLYGPDWRIPDPAFGNVDPQPGLRRLDGWFRGVRTHVVRWNELYRHRGGTVPRKRSSFSLWSAARMERGAAVVDLGSGFGRDSAYFHARGHRVIGVDYSGAALRQTRRRLTRKGDPDPDVRPLPFNDLRAALLAGAELAREPEPPYLYARGLVGCLDLEARTNLWRLSSMSLRRGGALFLEYAATRPGLRRASPPGLVRRVSTRRLVREITASGGRVAHREVGPGLDFFDKPDPHVARLEVRWDPDPTHKENQMSVTSNLGRKLGGFPSWVRDLRPSLQENRRLNRRVAELTDVVTELLVPLADRDEEKARELLASYRETTFAP